MPYSVKLYLGVGTFNTNDIINVSWYWHLITDVTMIRFAMQVVTNGVQILD